MGFLWRCLTRGELTKECTGENYICRAPTAKKKPADRISEMEIAVLRVVVT